MQELMGSNTKNIDQLIFSHPKEAFKELYEKYYSALCNRALRVVNDKNIAEDIVQEVILELWKRKDDFEPPFNVIAYLYRSIYNRALNYVKSKVANFESDDILASHEMQNTSPIETIDQQNLLNEVKRLVNELPEKCRVVFSLSRYEEKSYKEIAEDLNISTKTVENQIGKALKVLRSKVDFNLISIFVVTTVGVNIF